MRTPFALWLLMALFVFPLACDAQEVEEAPRNVILFIADGCGPASHTFARQYLAERRGQEALAVDAILTGTVRTHAANSRVTDSAASATAYACGIKTYNGAIAMDVDQQPVATVLEAAEAAGMATGLVATSQITHATPASFSAHVPNRNMATEIAAQQLTQGIEVIFGGGRTHFQTQDDGGIRDDGRNLLAEAEQAGYHLALDRAAFDAAHTMPVLGLFTPGHMSYEIDRDPAQEPSLEEMTLRAIDLLSSHEEGFLLIVEGSRIDHAAHGNDAAGHLHDILAYDAAVAAALAFAEADGETLLLSTADHETGGLTLGRAGIYDWSPEAIDQVTASFEKMGNALREGTPWETIVEEMAGLTELADEDRVLLQEAHADGDGRVLFERIRVHLNEKTGIGWTSSGHTAVDVNLYAYGPGWGHFKGNLDNQEIGQRIAALFGFDLAATTAALRQETAGGE